MWKCSLVWKARSVCTLSVFAAWIISMECHTSSRQCWLTWTSCCKIQRACDSVRACAMWKDKLKDLSQQLYDLWQLRAQALAGFSSSPSGWHPGAMLFLQFYRFSRQVSDPIPFQWSSLGVFFNCRLSCLWLGTGDTIVSKRRHYMTENIQSELVLLNLPRTEAGVPVLIE